MNDLTDFQCEHLMVQAETICSCRIGQVIVKDNADGRCPKCKGTGYMTVPVSLAELFQRFLDNSKSEYDD